MGKLFGAKWERENGMIGGIKFFEWADIIEPMEASQIRSKFNELERRFKLDVSLGKDIWPPTIAYFAALCVQAPRVNEQAYKEFQYALPEKTKEEYQKIAKRGMDKLIKSLQGE